MIVEVVGPTGAGKSTLASRLRSQHADLESSESLRLGSCGHAPFVARQLPGLLPIVGLRWRLRPQLDRTQLKQMLYLSGWDRVLRRQEKRAGGSVLIDQGPVFYLAMLHGFGPGCAMGDRFERWWRSRVQVYARCC